MLSIRTSPRRAFEIVRRSVFLRRLSPVLGDGEVTILFSDMEGFTQMTERLGDRRALAVVRDHNRIVRDELTLHGGHEVELQGDGFLLAFAEIRQGIECAVAIQRALAAYNCKHEDEPIRVRMGLHHGKTIRDANRFFGKTVILATRIAGHARGGEILVSAMARELVEAATAAFRFGETQRLELKGLSGTHAVCAVGWQ